MGYLDGQPAVLVIIFRQPGANIIDTVDRIRAALPQLESAIPRSIKLTVATDQTVTIRASVHDVELTLLISIVLVGACSAFSFSAICGRLSFPALQFRSPLIGTFGAMYLLGYSIDNSLMAQLTISTGFVVDDAIVVIENITRLSRTGYATF